MLLAKHVLITDDEKRIREVVEYALEKEGYRVSSVPDPAFAGALRATRGFAEKGA